VITLALDASTYTGTVAVLRGPRVVAEGEAVMRGEYEERLMPEVAATIARAGVAPHDVERIICGAGPGSFTSLRIAAAIAKGMTFGSLALGRQTPLFAVSSLTLIVAGQPSSLASGRYLALLDAMREERYASLLEVIDSRIVRGLEGPPRRIAADDIADICAQYGARAIGPREELAAAPHARGVAPLLEAILAAGPVALDSWEPDYGRLAEAQVRWEAAHGRPLTRDAP
jgi:tRNA threonylcarbamoyladenosine biosynthesis protein TsaB